MEELHNFPIKGTEDNRCNIWADSCSLHSNIIIWTENEWLSFYSQSDEQPAHDRSDLTILKWFLTKCSVAAAYMIQKDPKFARTVDRCITEELKKSNNLRTQEHEGSEVDSLDQEQII